MALNKIQGTIVALLLATITFVTGKTTYEIIHFPKRINYNKEEIISFTRHIENKNGKKYALLLNGNGDHEQFAENIEFVYNSVKRAGFKDEDIFVLQSGNSNPKYVNGKANLKELKITFDLLKNKITAEDIFLLYTTNHGTKDKELEGFKRINPDVAEKNKSQIMTLAQKLIDDGNASLLKVLERKETEISQ